jgi:23S rRNA pseudouridine2457 synthase
MTTLVIFNKPMNVLSQFTDAENRDNLANYISLSGVYPAGRLDYDSEGLLLLTDDGRLQHRIASPAAKMPKTYWVQVEGEPHDSALQILRDGLVLKDGKTAPASVTRLQTPHLWERIPPIRHRQQIPTAWLSITITEGRNRQVRRMTAAVGYPTLRLVRVQIGPWQLENLQPGHYRLEHPILFKDKP